MMLTIYGYRDPPSRTLTTGVTGSVPGGSANMTVIGCTTACKTMNFLYAGLEYAQECCMFDATSYFLNSLALGCGNAFLNGGAPTTSGCTMACKGNTTEYCGGSLRLNVYQFGTVSATSTTSLSSTSSSSIESSATVCSCVGSVSTVTVTTSAASSTTSMTIPSSTSTSISIASSSSISKSSAAQTTSGTTSSSGQTSSTSIATSSTISSSATSSTISSNATGWSYRGCYIDGANGRILSNTQPANATMTNEQCITSCQAAGYSVAGNEYSTECYCGNAIINGGALVADTQCYMTCGGNSSEMCGAGSRMSIFAMGNLKTYGVPAAQTSGLPGKWQYKGCIS